MKDRLRHIDIAKGIAIILVVFAHNRFVMHDRGKLFNLLSSFLLPLFFFLSGIFFKPTEPFKRILIKKADSLLKPYYVTLLMLGAAYFLIRHESIWEYLFGVLYGNGATIKWVPLWFLPHLYLITLYAWCLLAITRLDKYGYWPKILGLLLMFSVGFSVRNFFWNVPVKINGENLKLFKRDFLLPGLPFSLDLIFLTGLYFLLGLFVKPKMLKFTYNPKLFWVALITFSLTHFGSDAIIDYNERLFDNLALSTGQALLGIYIVISLSSFISNFDVSSRMLSRIGEATLIILIFHWSIQENTFRFLNSFLGGYDYACAVGSFIIGLGFPFLVKYFIDRFRILQLMYYPIKSTKNRKRSPIENL
jgi:polysaccharide biosynthesis protein PslL